MGETVLSLDHPAARLRGVAGGKGSALARMRAAGLPVPVGFVVSAQVFGGAGSALPEELGRRLSNADPADTVALEGLCAAARRLVAERGVPAEVASAVVAAYEGLGDGVAVSVRSSATTEDQRWASFAGQYDSFLNVVGTRVLLERLLEVWQSLYSTRAVAYGLRRRVSLRSARMAVVVQRQLWPQAAGVLFTRDPRNGSQRHYVVNAALGLGEGVVSGRVPVDSFTVRRGSFEVESREVVAKDEMVGLRPEGGTARARVPAARRQAPALSDEQLAELGRLAERVVELFGGHQDIEFAVADGVVYLLQARPVTAAVETSSFAVAWDDPADEAYTWVRSQGPLFKLQEDAVRAYSEGSRVCFEETGSLQTRNHIVRFINGHSYTRAPEVAAEEVSRRQRRHRERQREYVARGTSLYDAEIRPRVEQALAELSNFRPKQATLSELVRHLERALEVYGQTMGDLHWRMAAATDADWPSTYREITGESEVASGALLQAIPNTTTRLVRRLKGLARVAQEDPELRSVFEDRAYRRLEEAPLRRRPAVRRFRSRLRSLLRDYGLRTGSGFGSGTSFATPTWNMDPRQPLDLVAEYVGHDLDELDRLEREARRDRERARRRVRRTLAGDPRRLARFERELALAVDEVKRMEDHNHLMEQGVSGALREAIYWTGRGLVRAGLLDDPDDVLHLSLDELKQVGAGSRPDLRVWVEERRREMEERRRRRAPSVLGRGGPPPPEPPSVYDLPSGVGLDGRVIRGVGASPGVVSGRARVVPGGSAVPAVERGDILVARNAGPAWTPVFPLLGGLVLDAGAVFQHASLVAREYGIPAVVMARDASSVIIDGQRVRVDADRGVVELEPSD